MDGPVDLAVNALPNLLLQQVVLDELQSDGDAEPNGNARVDGHGGPDGNGVACPNVEHAGRRYDGRRSREPWASLPCRAVFPTGSNYAALGRSPAHSSPWSPSPSHPGLRSH